MTNLDRAKHINQMMAEGKLLEAFDMYYHENSVKVEGDGSVVEGKAANREFQLQWLESTEEFHGMGAKNMAENEEEGVVLYEAWADVTYKGGHRVKMEQVVVQKWADGQIVHIRFYYNPAAMGG